MKSHNRIKVTIASDGEWIDFCKKSRTTTFFHTPFWADVFVNRYSGRYKKSPFKVIFDDGTEIIIPLVKQRRFFGLLPLFCSMPASTYGGPISIQELDNVHETEVLRFLERFPNLIVRENPYTPLKQPFNSTVCIEDPTQTIDLSVGYETIWKNAARSHHKCVRNAIKNGVVISEAQSSCDWDEYISIYKSSIDRWRKRNIFSGEGYDDRFFEGIRKIRPSMRKLWLAKVNNSAVAGIICFYWNDHAVAWHGSARSEYFNVYPNNLLYDRAMYDAEKNGYRWFDCNPCRGFSGVYRFKQYLGAHPLGCRVLVRWSPVVRFLKRLRKGMRK